MMMSYTATVREAQCRDVKCTCCVCVCVHVIQRVIGSCDRLLCDKMFECTSPVNVGFCD